MLRIRVLPYLVLSLYLFYDSLISSIWDLLSSIELITAIILFYYSNRLLDVHELPKEPATSNPNILEGKTILVTGGNTGIGFEATCHFAKLGGNVVIASRNKTKVFEIVWKI